MTDNERLAEAILVWRWSRHRLLSTGPTPESEAAAYAALDLAKRAGVLAEFMALLVRHPVLTVTVRELERDRDREPAKPRARKQAAHAPTRRPRKAAP